MKYRALGRSNQAISALTLRIDDGTPANLRAPLVYAALEAGINSFDIAGADLALLDDVGPALGTVERRLLFVSMRFGVGLSRTGELVRDFSPDRLTGAIEAAASRSGLRYLDLALLDDPAVPELPLRSLSALKAAREEGRTRRLGVAGHGPAMDAYINTGAFDVLFTPYSLTSGWQDRNRLKSATGAEMAIVAYDYFPQALHRRSSVVTAAGGLFSRILGKPAAKVVEPQGPYAFLDQVAGWTAEEICLAYALTEPGLASVSLYPSSTEILEQLASVPDRELPSFLPAQIEMARFAAVQGAA